jgi:hypothetical protein
VSLSEEQLKAIRLSRALSSFLVGRDASAPIPKNQPISEENIAIIGEYERETVKMYREIYGPQVKQMHDELAREGHSDAQLDAIYGDPQGSDSIRTISQDLEKLGSQDNTGH